tara:strand:+ start:2893 stop:3225 length:333 start_codon:yes stop_codon:yes gene_type:complete
MANKFKLHAADVTVTSEITLLTVPPASTYLIGSIIVANVSVGTDTTVDLVITDSSQALDFNILKDEPMDATISKEILSRALILENGDSLKIQVADADTVNVLISYMDRSR